VDKILCVISGGMDSATLLYKAMTEREEKVEAISFNYGQRHKKELAYAAELCGRLNVRHDIIDLSSITPYIGGSSLTDDIAVPDGHYTEDSMKITVVPNRNAIMLAVAFGVAVARNSSVVGAGMHAGDHAIYPDCRPEFVSAFDAMQRIAVQGHGDSSLHLWTPFINQSKADIAVEGGRLGVNYEMTWSCYKGQSLHCGKCGTCYERREAFELAGMKDPTKYTTTGASV
jgi:7-cyano-7-deazaguanine synthase